MRQLEQFLSGVKAMAARRSVKSKEANPTLLCAEMVPDKRSELDEDDTAWAERYEHKSEDESAPRHTRVARQPLASTVAL
jgi:hypothetical protein